MAQGLDTLDTLIVFVYLAAIVGMSFVLALRQRTGEDYFLAGRRMGGATLALSILANQASAVSLVGAPAFVALREGGGLRWLQYELAVPLAMLLLIILLLPAIRSVPGSSIYAYAERRFGRNTRRALAGAFLLSRGLSLGVIIYASAIVLAQVIGWSLGASLLAVGLFSVAYTSLGGFIADVWSDVLQFVLLWAGTLVAALFILVRDGARVIAAIPSGRSQALVFDSTGLGDGGTFSFWPMLVGGLFLYLAYYGCDQSQAQRLLAARSDEEARRALLINGLLRFPLVLTYCGLGLLLAGLLRVDATLAARMVGAPVDALVPTFLVTYLPTGLRGLLLAAILAAAMSSIDSALNSLAAVTLEDVVGIPPERQPVWLSRLTSLAWGLFAVASGLAVARSGQGVIELVNQVGSAFYGPVLAVFVLGVLAPRVRGGAATTGMVAGIVGNLLLARLAPGVSWLWWNPIGFAVASTTALLLTTTAGRLATGPVTLARPGRDGRVLVGAFAVMLAVLAIATWR